MTADEQEQTMRVAVALPGLHRIERGAEIALEAIAGHLARREDTTVTLFGAGPQKPERPYSYVHVPAADRSHFERWPRGPLLHHEFRYEELSFLPGLMRAYHPEDFDVTLGCTVPTNWVLGRRRRRGRRPAIVYATDCGDDGPRHRSRSTRLFTCDGLICTNPQYYEANRDDWYSVLVPNGADTSRFRPGPTDRSVLNLSVDGPLALIVSALYPRKRVLEGLEAVSRVAGLSVVVAGDGPQRDELDAFAEEHLAGRYHRLTFPPDRMPDVYRAADVFLHLATDEPFGNVYVEAAASGIPVVAHDWASTRWILGDERHLVDGNDLDAVAAELRSALQPEAKMRAHDAAASFANDFDWSTIADRYRAFFADVLERPRNHAIAR